METEKYLTLVSDTHNVDNFTVRFTDALTLGEDWEVIKRTYRIGTPILRTLSRLIFPTIKW